MNFDLKSLSLKFFEKEWKKNGRLNESLNIKYKILLYVKYAYKNFGNFQYVKLLYLFYLSRKVFKGQNNSFEGFLKRINFKNLNFWDICKFYFYNNVVIQKIRQKMAKKRLW